MEPTDLLPIGKLAARTGLSVSAIRFYEEKGLISAHRNAGGQRRFARADLRRLSFILIAQRLGFSLSEIRAALDSLPDGRAPTRKDWARLSRNFRAALDQRIGELERLRENLDKCIGCGCLSLPNCALYNPGDEISVKGAGPRLVIKDDT